MKRLLAWLLLATSCVQAQPLERKLVFLRSQGLSAWAESNPAFDYSCYLPRRYTMRGLDSGLIKATASTAGLPTRLLGRYSGDRVEVPATNLRLEPPLLPLSLSVKDPWRGVVALRRQASQMAAVPGQWQPCQAEPAADGLYQVTAWTENGRLHLRDLLALPAPPPPAVLQGPLRAIVSEGFLNQTMLLYRQSHPQLFQFADPKGRAGFELSSLGLTTIPGHLRAYASLNGQINGLGKLVEGEWEGPLQLELQGGYARVRLAAQGQVVRLVKPIFAEVPQAWADGVTGLAQQLFSNPLTVPVPGAYIEPLLASGLITRAELDQLQILPAGWGDRRSGCLLLTSAAGGSPPEQFNLAAPDGFALALSAEALNRSFRQSLPARLPMRIDLPSDRVPSPQVLIFKVKLKQLEIQQLNLTYQAGSFRFDPCVLAVAWQLGPLSGLEPGARVSGTAVPALENGQLVLRMKIEQLQFLSPQILQQSTENQQRLRTQVLEGLQKVPLPLAVPTRLATEIHSQAQLQITRVEPQPDALWLGGRWSQ